MLKKLLFLVLLIEISSLLGASETGKCLFRYVPSKDGKLVDETGKMPPATLKDGGFVKHETSGDFLCLDGRKRFALLNGTEKINIKKGVTISMVARFNTSGTEKLKPYSYGTLLFKRHSFILGHERGVIYFNFKQKDGYVAATFGSRKIPVDKWVHIAVTIKKEEDLAQGKSGYRITLYLNGMRDKVKIVNHVTPNFNNSVLDIGRGWGGELWFFNGDIGEVAMYDYPMTRTQIEKLAKTDKRIKFSSINMIRRLSSKVRRQLHAMERSAVTPERRWLFRSLRKLGEQTGNTLQLSRLIKRLSQAGKQISDVKLFNLVNSASEIKILATRELVAMLSDLPRVMEPVISIFSRKEKRELLAYGPGWSVEYGKQKPWAKKIDSSKAEIKLTDWGRDFITINWRIDESCLKMSASSTLRFSGSKFSFDFKVKTDDPEIKIHKVNFPIISFKAFSGENNFLAYPRMSGILIPNPAGFGISRNDIYPSQWMNMQFCAYFDKLSGNGLYFATEDPCARTKKIEINGYDGMLRYSCQWYPGIPLNNAPQKPYEISGEFVVQSFNGNWYEATQIYRDFLKNSKWWIKDLPRKDTPKWFRQNTTWALVFAQNEASQQKMLIQSKKFRDYLELPYALWWNNWFLNKPGWPHYIAQPGAPEKMRQISKNDIYVMPYLDSRLWAMADSDYPAMGAKYATHDIKGKLEIEIYAKKKYATMCAAASGWKEWVHKLYSRVGEQGGSILYHDQLSCKPILCYNPAHGHKLGGGNVWLEKGFWPMLKSLRKKQNYRYPTTSEDTSEPYLLVTDGFLPWRWVDNNRIPLFIAVYSGRAQFTGRVFNHSGKGSSESFFIKSAEQFVNGEQIGWFLLREVQSPGVERLFIKKLSHTRKTFIDFFNTGKFGHPVTFNPKIKPFTTNWGFYGYRLVTTPSVMSALWLKPEVAVILLVNPLEKQQTVYPTVNPVEARFVGKTVVAALITEAGKIKTKEFSRPGGFPVTLKPHSIGAILIGEKNNSKKFLKYISRIESDFKRIGSFTP